MVKPVEVDIESNETVDDLILGNYKLIQSKAGYRFSLDAVLLAHFVSIERSDEPVIDLGTGSGVIPILLSARSPDITVWGVELQPELAERAVRSVVINDLERRIKIIQGDVRNISSMIPASSSKLVMANPPFLPCGKGKVSKNREQALARHEIVGTLADFIGAANHLLLPGGRFCLVHQAGRLLDIVELFKVYKLSLSRIRWVHSYASREAKLLLIEGIKRIKTKLMVLPPLIIYEKPGTYSEEVSSWYKNQPGEA